jgi:CheY-like chemotaxis protein
MEYDPSILIADDALTGQKVLELLLKEEGYRIAFASKGVDLLLY